MASLQRRGKGLRKAALDAATTEEGKPAEGGIRWRRYRGGGKASGRRH